MSKYIIKITRMDPFSYEEYIDVVTAYPDPSHPDLLWYDDDYGQLGATYLSRHPEAIKETEDA